MNSKQSFDCSFLEINRPIKCHPVESITGESALCLQTSHLWVDKSPLSFYIIDLGSKVLITDDGETIFNLMVNNVVTNKRGWALLREKLDCTDSDIQLSDEGEIIGMSNKDNLNIILSNYISAMCALMHHERQVLGIPEDINNLAEEVEIYLKAWRPKDKLIKNPTIKGISNHEYKFDFELGNNLILAIKPTPNAVGSVMRKVGDVISGSHLNGRKVMVIVDDRGDDLFNKKADEEITIISSLAKAVPFTNLIRKSEKSSNPH